MKSVLVVDGAGGVTLRDLLGQRSFEVTTCVPDETIAKIGQSRPDLVVVCSLGDASAKFVAHLRQGVSDCPPTLVALSQRSDTARDQCLTIGAADIAPEGDPADVGARAETLLNGWQRGTPRKSFKSAMRAQRARQTMILTGADVDPTGFTFTGAAELTAGDLVRVALPLPAGQTIVWGRVSEIDGARAVRFLALAAEERARLESAVPTLTEAPSAATTRPSLPPIPVMARSVASMPPAPAGGPFTTLPKGASISVADEVTRPPSNVPPPLVIASRFDPAPSLPPQSGTSPTREATLRPVASTSPLLAPAPFGSVTMPPELSRPPRSPPTLPPPTPAPPVDPGGIDDLIGSSLDESAAAVPPPGPTGPLWPEVRYTDEATTAAFREGVTTGLVSGEPGAPGGETVVAFVRTLSIPEQHVLDKEPPASLPEPALATRVLALRLRLFAYAQDATTAAATGVRPEIDPALVAAVEAEVKAADAEMQKASGAFLASGDQARLKDITQFKNTLVRAQKDFRAALARLKGEAALEDGPAHMLDAEARPTGTTGYVRRDLPQEKTLEKSPDYIKPFEADSPAQRRERRRLSLWIALLVLLVGVFVLATPSGFKPLSAAEIAEVGAQTIFINSDSHKAKVIVPTGWKLEPHEQSLDKVMTNHRVVEWAVTTDKGVLVAFRKPSRGLIKTRAATTGGVVAPPPGSAPPK